MKEKNYFSHLNSHNKKKDEIRKLRSKILKMLDKEYKKLLKISEKKEVPDLFWSSLGLEFYYSERYASAEQAMFKAIEALEKQPKDEHKYFGLIYGELSMIYEAQEKYTEAYEMAKKSYEVALKYHGEDEPTIQSKRNRVERLERIMNALTGFTRYRFPPLDSKLWHKKQTKI